MSSYLPAANTFKITLLRLADAHLTDSCAFFFFFPFSVFPADFRAHFWGYCFDHQGDQLLCALQGLMPCRKRASLHTRGLLLKFLSQQHPTQLFLRSAPRVDFYHMGPGMLRQTLLQ